MKLYGAQRAILQALKALQDEGTDFVSDADIAQITQIDLPQVQNWLQTLEEGGLVSLTRTVGGFKAHIEAMGRLALEQHEPFPGQAGTEGGSQPEQVAEGPSIEKILSKIKRDYYGVELSVTLIASAILSILYAIVSLAVSPFVGEIAAYAISPVAAFISGSLSTRLGVSMKRKDVLFFGVLMAMIRLSAHLDGIISEFRSV